MHMACDPPLEYDEFLYRVLNKDDSAMDIADNEGRTPLMRACGANSWNKVEMLIENGARVDVESTDGETALTLAAKNSEEHSLIETILDAHAAQMDVQSTGTGYTALMAAASSDEVGQVKVLLDRGAKIDLQSKAHMTALMMASEKGHLEVVRLLLDRGANADLVDAEGRTALDLASSNGHDGVAALLRGEDDDMS